MSNAAWRIRKRIKRQYDNRVESDPGTAIFLDCVLNIIDEEIEREAEQQFTRPISKQAEMSRLLKEDKVSRTYTADDIDLKNPLHNKVGAAFALAAMTMPRREDFAGDDKTLTRAIIANVLSWFDGMGLVILDTEKNKEAVG